MEPVPEIRSWWSWPSVRSAMWAAILIGAGMALTCLLYTSQLMAGAGVAVVGMVLVPLLSGLFSV